MIIKGNMIKTCTVLLAVLALMFLSSSCRSTTPPGGTNPPTNPSEPGQPAEPITPAGYVSKMGVGLDVNWALFKREIRAYTKQMPQDMAKRGFTHARIRFKIVDDKKYLDHLEKVVRDTLDTGMYAIITLAAMEFNEKADEASLKKAVDWWRTVAERFKGYPGKLAFDLHIEPGKNLNKLDSPELLLKFYRESLKVVRPLHPKRVIFLAPRYWAQPEGLPEIEGLFNKGDKYLGAESHFYAAGPSKDSKSKSRWTTGTPEEKAMVQKHVDLMVEWRKKTGVPVWQGAWMPGNYNRGNDYTVEEQVVFATFVSCALRKAHIPYSVNADQHFYDVNKKEWLDYMKPVVDALLNPECGE